MLMEHPPSDHLGLKSRLLRDLKSRVGYIDHESGEGFVQAVRDSFACVGAIID